VPVLLVTDVLDAAVSATPRKVAVTLGDEAMTFAEMGARANRLANALYGWGVRRGDRVAYWADIAIEASPLQFALGRLGAAFVPMNPSYSYDEARKVCEYLGPRLLLADANHLEGSEVLTRDLDVPLLGTAPTAVSTLARQPSLDDLAAASAPVAPDAPLPKEEDVFAIFLTSGSTGTPKGVMVSQRATWLRAFAGSANSVASGGPGQLIMFPLFHMAGWFFAYHAWSLHQPAHFVSRPDGRLLLAAVDRYHPGSLYCIPAVWQRILDERGPFDTSSLEWALIGTSRVEPDLLEAIKARFPATRTTVSYGSTEIGRALSLGDHDLFRKPYSVGLPIPGLRARLAEDGELLLASDTGMSGYFNLPEETSRALQDGWFHTGDRVEVDDEGYFFVVGRTKEMIRSGGEWVAPIEVEAALSDYPGLAEVAVFGAPDPNWGEVIWAAVVLRDGATLPSVDDLRRHLSGRLAAFKHPRRVIAVDEVPRTAATGQLQRSRLITQAEEKS
jgi:acyl-CoA synthetase (AMP-forming)/AMP-acid ligase II